MRYCLCFANWLVQQRLKFFSLAITVTIDRKIDSISYSRFWRRRGSIWFTLISQTT